MSLDQIRRALDDPDWSLGNALRHHLASVDAELAVLASLRNGVSTALASIDGTTDQTPDLLEVLSTMDTLDSHLRRRISIMVYRDPGAAHHHLVNVFGLTPGGDHRRTRRHRRPRRGLRRRRGHLAAPRNRHLPPGLSRHARRLDRHHGGPRRGCR